MIAVSSLLYACCLAILHEWLGDVFGSRGWMYVHLLSNRVISTINAVTALTTAVLFLANVISTETFHTLQFGVVGYCIYDVVYNYGKPECYIRFKTEYLIHHLIFVVGATYILPNHPAVIAKAYLAEMTTIPLNVLWIIKSHPSPWNAFLKGWLWSGFLFFRVWGMWSIMVEAMNTWWVWGGVAGVMWILQVYWFILISSKIWM